MATICKVEKLVTDKNSWRYPRHLVWAVLDDEGKTVFETVDASDASFNQCLAYRDKHALQVSRCLTCED